MLLLKLRGQQLIGFWVGLLFVVLTKKKSQPEEHANHKYKALICKIDSSHYSLGFFPPWLQSLQRCSRSTVPGLQSCENINKKASHANGIFLLAAASEGTVLSTHLSGEVLYACYPCRWPPNAQTFLLHSCVQQRALPKAAAFILNVGIYYEENKIFFQIASPLSV